MTAERADTVGAIVAGVLRQAVEDAGASGVIVLEPETPEGRLVLAWSMRCLGADRVWRIDPGRDRGAGGALDTAHREELERGMARIVARERNALVLHPANKTVLLLDDVIPPEPVLPMGDVYASTCDVLAGGWSAGPAVRRLADAAGGVSAVDAALSMLLEERLPPHRALGHLPEAARNVILQRLEAGRFWRRRVGLVPKLGTRTLGIDLSG